MITSGGAIASMAVALPVYVKKKLKYTDKYGTMRIYYNKIEGEFFG